MIKHLLTILFVSMSLFSFGQKYKSIKPSKVCEYIKNHPNAVVLDVRTKEEYEGKSDPEQGTFHNAINIPVQELDRRVNELEKYKNSDVIVYCTLGKRSARASSLLAKSGFKSVYNLDGGIMEMKDGDCVSRIR
jgi:rhodanese-related sulfurtransferase